MYVVCFVYRDVSILILTEALEPLPVNCLQMKMASFSFSIFQEQMGGK